MSNSLKDFLDTFIDFFTCQDSVAIVGRTYIARACHCKEANYEDTSRGKINKKYFHTFPFN